MPRAAASARSAAPTGVRRERLVQQVLRATAIQLGESGYGALRFEDVAKRAGVNKTSLYRRWPTKADLVRDMLLRLDHKTTHSAVPPPNTGSFRTDLRRMLENKAKMFTLPETRGFLRLLFSDIDDFDVGAIVRSKRSQEISDWDLMFMRAQERGELRPAVDPRLVAETFMSGLLIRRMVLKEPVDAHHLYAVANLLLDGCLLPESKPRRAR